MSGVAGGLYNSESSKLKSCVKVRVAFLCSPSLIIVLTISVDVKLKLNIKVKAEYFYLGLK